jgi:hypothetical protein
VPRPPASAALIRAMSVAAAIRAFIPLATLCQGVRPGNE